METVKKFVTSRKLWITVLGAVYFVLQGDYDAAEKIVMVYLGAQGLSDAAARYNPVKE